jgi:hypothetical protein
VLANWLEYPSSACRMDTSATPGDGQPQRTFNGYAFPAMDLVTLQCEAIKYYSSRPYIQRFEN